MGGNVAGRRIEGGEIKDASAARIGKGKRNQVMIDPERIGDDEQSLSRAPQQATIRFLKSRQLGVRLHQAANKDSLAGNGRPHRRERPIVGVGMLAADACDPRSFALFQIERRHFEAIANEGRIAINGDGQLPAGPIDSADDRCAGEIGHHESRSIATASEEDCILIAAGRNRAEVARIVSQIAIDATDLTQLEAAWRGRPAPPPCRSRCPARRPIGVHGASRRRASQNRQRRAARRPNEPVP